MPTIRVVVNVDVDGTPVPSLSAVARMELETSQAFEYEKAADNDSTTFSSLAGVDALSAVNVLIVRAQDAVNLRLNGQSTSLIPLRAGGLLVLIDTALETTTLASINNPEASATARVRGYAGGA